MGKRKRLDTSMHNDNTFKDLAIDFAALAQRHADLRVYLVKKPRRNTDQSGFQHTLKFKEAGAMAALCGALMQEYYGLTWWMP